MTAAQRTELARQNDLQNRLKNEEAEYSRVTELYDTMENISIVNMKIEHKQYGTGIVKAQDGSIVTIEFAEKTVKFQFPAAFKTGKIVLEDEGLAEYFTSLYELESQNKALENRINSIKRRM